MSAVAWLLAFTARAEATDPPRVALVWKAPAQGECASADEIRAEVDRLSDSPLVTRDEAFEIEALALFHEGSWVASVALRDAAGRVMGGREVSGPYLTCRALDVPVALVVATLLDELGQASPAPPVAPPAPPASNDPPAPARAQPRHPIGVGAFVTGAWGLSPKLSLGAGIAVELALGWPLVFSMSAYLPGRELDASERGAWLFSFHGGAASCPRLAGKRHALRLCGSAQVGAVLADGENLTESQREARPMILLGLEPQLMLGLTPNWALQLALGAEWLPLRPRFHWEIEGAPAASAGPEPFALLLRIGVIDFVR